MTEEEKHINNRGMNGSISSPSSHQAAAAIEGLVVEPSSNGNGGEKGEGVLVVAKKKEPLKRFVGPRAVKRIPDDIMQDKELAAAVSHLPYNYNFEIYKTIWRVREAGAKRVALQFPEGLLMYACVIGDILERFARCEVVIMGDVTYGACCVDDLTARAVGCDFLVHYGHSCLVPMTNTSLKALYVFVEIGVDSQHLVKTLKMNLEGSRRVCLMGTIQFVTAVHEAAQALKDHFYQQPILVPQAKPLSAGEVLGCTAPLIDSSLFDTLVFVADGRFHLEAAMIANPSLEAYRYNPYDKSLTKEYYDTPKMLQLRREAVDVGRKAKQWGVILGTLGRQGNPGILKHAISLLEKQGRDYFVMLLSEITPAKLSLMKDEVEAWVQIACPRLSIDWGHFFDKPVLTAYEFEVAMGEAEWKENYPMDYYAKGSGVWTNMHPGDNAKRVMP